MTNSDYPWEPPIAGTEAEQVFGALERLRTTFRWKADGLDADALAARVGASALTLGGLLKHLAACEDTMWTHKLSGTPLGEPWEALGWNHRDSWDFTFDTAGMSADELYALYDGAVDRARARVAAVLTTDVLDQPAHIAWPGDRHASLRRLVCDLIEEYGRHTGHADLLRESVDGVVGEDPPAGWRPKSGTFRVPNAED